MLVLATRQETSRLNKLHGVPATWQGKESKWYCAPLAAQVEGRFHCAGKEKLHCGLRVEKGADNLHCTFLGEQAGDKFE